jgi:hypothetical protein
MSGLDRERMLREMKSTQPAAVIAEEAAAGARADS